MFHTATQRAALVVTFGVALAGSGLVAQASAAPAPQADGLTNAQVNRELDKLAKQLAVASDDDPELRKTIHGAVKKRFDGDENALLSTLVAKPNFTARVAGPGKSKDAIAKAAEKIPRLQVAVPRGFDSWDPATYAPLVAYFPQGVDDTKVKTLTAYDAAGNTVTLDAQVAPKRPVIVVGLNERTDEEGELLKQTTTSLATAKTSQTNLAVNAVEAAAARTAYSVDIRIVHLIKDKEPWALGDAEISMKARSRGCSGVEFLGTDWSNLNNDDDWWAPGGVKNMGKTTCDVVFYWWEDDGGAFDFSLSFNGFGLGVKMDNDDDMIGGKQLGYASFKGGGTDQWMKVDDWDALHMWVE
ncbi:hypothetical protein AFL01nite_14340 [Aeromicrobium flavum]|uniref:Uncharacterized protein n=1 Tax=Aeromicrobium flavum TaxID=416568 RepID=A0A512HUI4_9ACTN|nr:hypothetical protein AFL01nite_14340 [Aeromicrobium flavum]